MGQHTWFYADKQYKEELDRLWNEIDILEVNETGNEEEIVSLYEEIDRIEKLVETEFHDCFRISKRTSNRSYIDDVLLSRDECMNFIFKNKEFLYHFDGESLAKFWDKYPNGYIEFG